MVTVYDVPPDELIERTALKLKEYDEMEPPEWSAFVKTGRHKESAPVQDDWWYIRAASVLRKIFINGPIGSSKLASEYGGYADRGSEPNKSVKGSRSIVRKCMIQLESAGLLTKKDNQGRVVTPEGQSLLDQLAKEVYDTIES